MSTRVLITGSRRLADPQGVREAIRRVIEKLPDDTVIIEGGAQGVDTFARWEAGRRGLWVVTVPVEKSHWGKHGRSAGFRRNRVMLDLEPELVIAFHDGVSRGTQGCIDEARRRSIHVEVIPV